jgi:hypothetical protein
LQITSNHSKEQKPLIVLFPSPVPSKSWKNNLLPKLQRTSIAVQLQTNVDFIHSSLYNINQQNARSFKLMF